MTFRVLNKRRLTIGSLAIFLATLAAQLVVVNLCGGRATYLCPGAGERDHFGQC